ncbi:RNA methyltransferase [bacterium]|nr:RNA methyltransferase [bacterium]
MEYSQVISKNQVKLIKSLAIKKYRLKNKLFIAEGRKVLSELFKSDYQVEKCWITDTENKDQLPDYVEFTPQKMLNEISQLKQPHFGLALVKIPEEKTEVEAPVSLVLDGIADPGNLGTIIRLADWYGLSQLFCINHCVDPFSPKVVQATMGSIFRVHIFERQTEQIKWKNKVYGAMLNGTNLHHINTLNTPCHLVIGSEADGISEEVKACCTESITIPRFGAAESLNAAVATGIILDRFAQLCNS